NRNRSRHEHADSDDASSGHDVMPLAPFTELIPVSPRRHFGALRISNSNEFQTFGHSREPDVFRRHAQFRVAKQSLALFDRFPSLFDGSEIPSFARATHYPQSALLSIERQTTSDGEMLDYLVRTEVVVAEETGRVHALFAFVNTLATDVRREDTGLEDVARRYRHDVLIEHGEVGVLAGGDGPHHVLLEPGIRGPDRHRLESF